MQSTIGIHVNVNAEDVDRHSVSFARLLLVLEDMDDEHGSKHFFLVNSTRFGDLRKNRGLL
jgi:hypothetical protein